MTWVEWLQMVLGFSVPLMLAAHLMGTRAAHEVFDLAGSYKFTLMIFWVFLPYLLWLQPIALLAAWGHGCLGLHQWLRFKPAYRTRFLWLFALAVLLPGLSIGGFITSSMQVVELAQDPAWRKAVATAANAPSSEAIAWLTEVTWRTRWGFAGLIVATLLARWARIALGRRKQAVAIDYSGQRTAHTEPGKSILEVSRTNGIPHAAVCGGRGRCSTCRVRVGAGLEDLPPPSEDELKVLRRIGAAPNARLACQARPTKPVAVTPLLPPHAPTQATNPQPGTAPASLQGQRREIAVMFIDIRGFTSLAEHRLPYDVVFILNRYFAKMGDAVESAGGRIDKFIGDGVMALFGIDADGPTGSRQALAAARQVGERLEVLNRDLASELSDPLRIGIAIHAGPAIVGEMGYKQVVGVTAIGDAVNTASRLETMTKEFGVQLVVSGDLEKLAGADLSSFEQREIEVRGRKDQMSLRLVKNAVELP